MSHYQEVAGLLALRLAAREAGPAQIEIVLGLLASIAREAPLDQVEAEAASLVPSSRQDRD